MPKKKSYGGGGNRHVRFQVHQKPSKSARIGSEKKLGCLLFDSACKSGVHARGHLPSLPNITFRGRAVARGRHVPYVVLGAEFVFGLGADELILEGNEPSSSFSVTIRPDAQCFPPLLFTSPLRFVANFRPCHYSAITSNYTTSKLPQKNTPASTATGEEKTDRARSSRLVSLQQIGVAVCITQPTLFPPGVCRRLFASARLGLLPVNAHRQPQTDASAHRQCQHCHHVLDRGDCPQHTYSAGGRYLNQWRLQHDHAITAVLLPHVQVKRGGGTALYLHEFTPHGGGTCLRSTRAHLAFRAGCAPRLYQARTCKVEIALFCERLRLIGFLG